MRLSVDRIGAHEELSNLVGNALTQLVDGFGVNSAIRILVRDKLVQRVCNGDLRQRVADFGRWNDGCTEVLLLLLATLCMRLSESRVENETVRMVGQVVGLVAWLLVASIDRFILIVTVLVITDILLLSSIVVLVVIAHLSSVWMQLILVVIVVRLLMEVVLVSFWLVLNAVGVIMIIVLGSVLYLELIGEGSHEAGWSAFASVSLVLHVRQVAVVDDDFARLHVDLIADSGKVPGIFLKDSLKGAFKFQVDSLAAALVFVRVVAVGMVSGRAARSWVVIERHSAGHGGLVVVGMSSVQTGCLHEMEEIKVDAFESWVISPRLPGSGNSNRSSRAFHPAATKSHDLHYDRPGLVYSHLTVSNTSPSLHLPNPCTICFLYRLTNCPSPPHSRSILHRPMYSYHVLSKMQNSIETRFISGPSQSVLF
jgi:hypothetical protein